MATIDPKIWYTGRNPWTVVSDSDRLVYYHIPRSYFSGETVGVEPQKPDEDEDEFIAVEQQKEQQINLSTIERDYL